MNRFCKARRGERERGMEEKNKHNSFQKEKKNFLKKIYIIPKLKDKNMGSMRVEEEGKKLDMDQERHRGKKKKKKGRRNKKPRRRKGGKRKLLVLFLPTPGLMGCALSKRIKKK